MLPPYKASSQPADDYPLDFSKGLVKAFGAMLDNPNGHNTPVDHVVRTRL
jgi:hypothetical protein